MFPTYLLQKVYQKGSLKNNEDGFEFSLKNIVNNGTLVGLNPLIVNGESFPAAAVRLVSAGKEISGSQVTNRTPLPIPVNSQMRLVVTGRPLPPGAHEITISLVTREIGLVKFKISDVIE
jgi:hypothetical protein